MNLPLKYLAPLLLTPAFAACSQSNPLPVQEGSGMPLSFRQAVAATKADAGYYIDGVYMTGIPAGKSFGAYVWDGAPEGRADFMSNEDVHNDGGSLAGDFSYSPVKYWPKDHGLSFRAYYPYDDGTLGTGITPNDESGDLSLSFSVKPDAEDQVDLLVATPADLVMEPAGGVHTVHFRHALSRILVKTEVSEDFSAGGVDVSVDEVTLSGIKMSGTCKGTSLGVSWSALSGSGSFECNGASIAETLLLIPQGVSGVKVSMTYTITFPGAPSETTTASMDLLSAGSSNWEAGKTYRYTVRLNANFITVSLDVLPWDYFVREIDYSTEVTVKNSGRIAWEAGTYASKDEGDHTLLLAFGTEAQCHFTIDTPAGAVWKAVLKTESGSFGAFEFVDDEGNGKESVSGEVGEQATLRIRATDDYPAQLNSAVLSVYVESGGRNIPVSTLVDDEGHEWTIVQNRNL